MIKNGIYKFENKINHMIYIGQASDLKKRYKKHFLNMSDKSHQEDFYIALREYGWNNFDYEILESFPSEEYNSDKLDELEDYYIKYFNSLKPNGYNMVPGGHHNGGLVKRLKVCQYDLQGNFLKEYESILSASRITGINDSNIVSCCKFIRNQAGGYQWRYSSDNLNKIDDITNDIKQLNVSILQFSLEGKLLNQYQNLTEASNKTNTGKSSICKVCKNKKGSANNYQWRYENDIGEVLNISKAIYQLDNNGNIIAKFDNATIAAETLKISRGNLGECLAGKRKTAGGFKWTFVKNFVII